MKKWPLYLVELSPGPAYTDLQHNNNFIESFQTAILLALLEKGQLARWQFDCCMDALKKQRNAEKSPGAKQISDHI